MNAVTPIGKKPLSFLDPQIVEMAREDGPLSLNPGGLVARLARFFGANVTHGLENARQEALRRFSVRAWYWDLIRTTDIRAFFDAGYSRTDVLEILSRVRMVRGFTPTIEEDSAGPKSPPRGASHCRCG